jgi:hypothetical protein
VEFELIPVSTSCSSSRFSASAHLPTIGHLQQTQLVMHACNRDDSLRVELVATPRIDEDAVTLITLRDQNNRLVTADERHHLKSVNGYAMKLPPLPCRPILLLPI